MTENPNPNAVKLFLPLDLLLEINKDGAPLGQLTATVILKILTEHYKGRLEKEVYDSLIAAYSLSALEQREKKRLRREEKARKTEARTPSQERKLNEEIVLCETRLRQKSGNPDYWNRRLEDAKAILQTLTESKAEETRK